MWGAAYIIHYYIDGVLKEKTKPLNPLTNFKFIGNSADGKEPFGIIADFRLYPFVWDPKEIKEYISNKTSPKPDRFHDYFCDGEEDKFVFNII